MESIADIDPHTITEKQQKTFNFFEAMKLVAKGARMRRKCWKIINYKEVVHLRNNKLHIDYINPSLVGERSGIYHVDREDIFGDDWIIDKGFY